MESIAGAWILTALLVLAAGEASAVPESRDCVAGACTEIEVHGDAVSTLPDGTPSPFRGFADPSVRRDPASGGLWMAYSWPNVQASLRGGSRSAVPGVEIHLAHSRDDGRTWVYDGPLWTAQPATDLGGSGEEGRTEHEVASLVPARTRSGLVWYAAALEYFLPARGGFRRRPASSFRILVTRADSPGALADAPSARLGSNGTAPGWAIDVNLSSLSPEVESCGMWNEPALHVAGDQLFLALRGLRFRSGAPDVAHSDVVVFATRPGGEVGRWLWRYAGTLAGAAEAHELGGEGLTQIDLARGRDGTLLALLSPDAWDPETGDFRHFGCRVVEVASLDPPRLARDSEGRLRVRAAITASDLAPAGPGACAYDPASATGVVLVRRQRQAPGMIASMHATGVHP